MAVVRLFAQHIYKQFSLHKNEYDNESTAPPLFVAMQGPQGSGKTTVCSSLKLLLSKPPFNLNVAVMSIDDLYHTHDDLVKIAQANRGCALLNGRGQPGTHDVKLGSRIFESLQRINHTGEELRLPIFDKSLFNGEGDRSKARRTISAPLDIFILEGWSMGFRNVTGEEVQKIWHSSCEESILRKHSIQHLLSINNNLKEYVDRWYYKFHLILQIKTDDLNIIYQWRLQQEHALRSTHDGSGMTDDQVKEYMPGYLLFLSTVTENTHWRGKSLTIHIDQDRNLKQTVNW